MRLWHYKILPYSPRTQLLFQKRECDLIWKDLANGKQTKHVLINYIWEYRNPKIELLTYYLKLKEEFEKRGYKFNCHPYINLFDIEIYNKQPFSWHHDYIYLRQCYFNLEEKYMRGQKDFDDETFRRLELFMILNGGKMDE